MISALLYMCGALLVFGGAFMPLAGRVYGTHDPAARVAAVRAAPSAWRWHHILFGAGAITTAAASIWEAIGSGSTGRVAAAVGFTLGALVFVHFLQARLLMPPTAWFGSELGKRRFAAFTILTGLAIVLRGVAAVQAGHASGTFLAGYGAILVGLFVILRDMPPFAHYIGTFGLGAASLS